MKLDIAIEADDEVTPWLARIARDIEGGRNVNGLNGYMARALGETTREYLRKLAPLRHDTANSLGGKPTGHLERGAEAVSSKPEEDGVVIDIPIPGIARAFGDMRIAAVRSKWLTIPANGEAYGRRARSFSDLIFRLKGGSPSDAPLAMLLQKQEDGKLRVMYWLKKSVFQKQDRTLLPSDDELLQSAEDAAEGWLDYQENLPKEMLS
jgi:hypothetical protein